MAKIQSRADHVNGLVHTMKYTAIYCIHMYMAYMAMFFKVILGGNFHIVGDLNWVGSLEDISDK